MTRDKPPQFLFLQTNQRCNLRCTHCEYWKLNDNDSDNYLSRERRAELIEEFAALGGTHLVTCGGEPMLDLEDYFSLMGAARRNGLRALSVVNGTRIKTSVMARAMIMAGPHEITVSLDHWSEVEHDRLRGRSGSWKMATEALLLLLEARERYDYATPIYAMTILSEDTWPTLDQFYRFALKELGVDKLKLNPLQPTFQGMFGHDEYFESARVRDVDGCMAMIRRCDEEFKSARNPAWLRDVEMHLRSVKSCSSRLLGFANRGTTDAICNSYDRNIMVDLYGVARLCFSGSYPGVQLNERGDLKKFWNVDSLQIRESMLGCKQFCGISHSVRKNPSLLISGEPT